MIGFCSILGKNTAFCVYSVHVKSWCAANSNLAYSIELTIALECQKQLLMSSISNLGGYESLEIAVKKIIDKQKLSIKLSTALSACTLAFLFALRTQNTGFSVVVLFTTVKSMLKVICKFSKHQYRQH